MMEITTEFQYAILILFLCANPSNLPFGIDEKPAIISRRVQTTKER